MADPPPPRQTVAPDPGGSKPPASGWLDRQLSRLEAAVWRPLKAVPLRWWIRAAVLLPVLITATYLLGDLVGWADGYRDFVDRAWTVFDYTAERARIPALIVGALIPALIAWVAYRTYQNTLKTTQSERWWKRAEWALDASTDDSPLRQHMGKKVLARLKLMDIAPEDEKDLLEDVTARDIMAEMLQELNEDPEATRDKAAPPAQRPSPVQDAWQALRQIVEEIERPFGRRMDEPEGKDG